MFAALLAGLLQHGLAAYAGKGMMDFMSGQKLAELDRVRGLFGSAMDSGNPAESMLRNPETADIGLQMWKQNKSGMLDESMQKAQIDWQRESQNMQDQARIAAMENEYRLRGGLQDRNFFGQDWLNERQSVRDIVNFGLKNANAPRELPFKIEAGDEPVYDKNTGNVIGVAPVYGSARWDKRQEQAALIDDTASLMNEMVEVFSTSGTESTGEEAGRQAARYEQLKTRLSLLEGQGTITEGDADRYIQMLGDPTAWVNLSDKTLGSFKQVKAIIDAKLLADQERNRYTRGITYRNAFDEGGRVSMRQKD